jgi:glycosyltransferase involved in cell wall biosynthesis
MKVSGFTFIRNAQMLGYPFVQSIKSILPIVDEFVIALGPCADETEKMLEEIKDPKIRIIHTKWNENMKTKGFVYGQQKSIALFNCTGDWAFYLEADEVVHETELPGIQASMEKYLDDRSVEALVFDYIHFYGNQNTYAWSPGWYRKAPRLLRNNVPAWSSEALFFNILENHKKARYPKAAHAGARIFHYGWIRSEDEMNEKSRLIEKYWSSKDRAKIQYSEIDGDILKEFKGTHPAVMQGWLSEQNGVFKAAPSHKLTKKEIKHRIGLALERLLGIDLSKKHYRLVK